LAEQRRTAAREDRKEILLLAWDAGACPALASTNYKSQPAQRLLSPRSGYNSEHNHLHHTTTQSVGARGQRAGRQPKSQPAQRLLIRCAPSPFHALISACINEDFP